MKPCQNLKEKKNKGERSYNKGEGSSGGNNKRKWNGNNNKNKEEEDKKRVEACKICGKGYINACLKGKNIVTIVDKRGTSPPIVQVPRKVDVLTAELKAIKLECARRRELELEEGARQVILRN